MQEYPTIRDASLSLWQSAVADICREEECGDQQGIANTDGNAPAVDMTQPLNAATGAYVAGSGQEPDRQEQIEKLCENCGDRDPEVSALYHKLAEARAQDNSVLEKSLSKALEETADLGIRERSLWNRVSERFVNFTRLFRNSIYRSWEREGSGDLEYSTIAWRVPSHGTVAMMGDWGTGTRNAVEVLKAACAFTPDAIIHLGDIYMTAMPVECERNVIAPIRRHAINRKTGEPIPFFAMAGNHEYYSGGHGFYWMLDRLNRNDQVQPASYFRLLSQDGGWQFLAADTGFKARWDILMAHGMGSVPRTDETPWLHHKLETFPGRTILLTHHQAFSNHDRLGGDPEDLLGRDAVNTRLIETFTPYNDRIAGWFWGHEHDLVLFDEYMGVKKGRCVGHGGRAATVASFRTTIPPAIPVADVLLGIARDGRHLNNGFQIVHLHGSGNPVEVVYYEVEMPPADESPVVRELYRELLV